MNHDSSISLAQALFLAACAGFCLAITIDRGEWWNLIAVAFLAGGSALSVYGFTRHLRRETAQGELEAVRSWIALQDSAQKHRERARPSLRLVGKDGSP